MNLPLCVSLYECECAYTYVCTCVDFYVFMWCLTPEGMLCFRGGGGGVVVSPCV